MEHMEKGSWLITSVGGSADFPEGQMTRKGCLVLVEAGRNMDGRLVMR